MEAEIRRMSETIAWMTSMCVAAGEHGTAWTYFGQLAIWCEDGPREERYAVEFYAGDGYVTDRRPDSVGPFINAVTFASREACESWMDTHAPWAWKRGAKTVRVLNWRTAN